MNGLTIFTHSIRQVTGNLGMAIRVSGGFWLALVGFGFVYGFVIAITNSTLLAIVIGIAFLVFLVWGISLIAVVWHRFILLEEQPTGFIPSRAGLNVWSYFWTGVGIGLIVIAAMLVLFLVATLFMDAKDILAAFDQNNVSMAPRDIIMRFAVSLISSLISLRLALVLPAVALGESFRFRDAWAASKPFTGSILNISLALAVLSAVLGVGMGLALIAVNGTPLLVLFVSVLIMLIQWFVFMLNISILSTLYGHIVQKREVH